MLFFFGDLFSVAILAQARAGIDFWIDRRRSVSSLVDCRSVRLWKLSLKLQRDQVQDENQDDEVEDEPVEKNLPSEYQLQIDDYPKSQQITAHAQDTHASDDDAFLMLGSNHSEPRLLPIA